LYPIFLGETTRTLADIRLILSVALKTAATGIILSADDDYYSFLDDGQL